MMTGNMQQEVYLQIRGMQRRAGRISRRKRGRYAAACAAAGLLILVAFAGEAYLLLH